MQQMHLPWQNKPSISLYVQQSANTNQVHDLQQQVNHIAGVSRTTVITPAQGLAEFSKVAQLGNLYKDPKTNPLPAVIVVTPGSQLTSAKQLNQLYNQLESLPNIDTAQLDKTWIERLIDLVQFFTHIGIVLAVLFGVGVVLITSNTIRLTLQSHQEEIDVMRLVGACRSTIARPIVYQGVWLGLFAGLVALAIIIIGYLSIAAPMHDFTQSYHLAWQNAAHIWLSALGYLVLAGMALCWIGAWVIVRRTLAAREQLH
jgi:cell division transport system permease protein